MSESVVQLWTGIAGIGFFVLVLIEIPLYFVYSGAPPPRNVLARSLINMFGLVVLMAFLAGFRHVIVQARPDYELLGTLALALGATHVVLTYVAGAVQAGSVLGKTERLDPTVIGSGAETSLIIYGPISRLLEAAFLGVAGGAILATGILPAWTAWLAFAVGALQLAMVPTLFYKTDPAHFYSVNGWGIPVAGGLFSAWLLAVSIVLAVSA
jgi:hypothetical protein